MISFEDFCILTFFSAFCYNCNVEITCNDAKAELIYVMVKCGLTQSLAERFVNDSFDKDGYLNTNVEFLDGC